MASISIRPEDRLEGTSNFNTWKARVFNILEENDIDSFVTFVIEEPTTNVGRTNYKKNQAKEKWIIYDSVKDNLMLVITPLKTTKECFETLMNIYEKKAPTQKRALKNKLRNMKMEKDETVASFFKNISQVKDQIVSIGVNMNEYDILQTTIDRLPSSLETFLVAVNRRKEKPNFEMLCHDCIQ